MNSKLTTLKLKTRWKRISHATTAMVTVFAAVMAFRAYSHEKSVLLAAMFAIAGAVFQLTAWAFLSDAWGQIPRQKQKVLLVLLLLIIPGGTIVVSTAFVYVELAGVPAQRLDVKRAINEATTTFGKLQQRRRAESGVRPVLDQQAKQLQRLSESESRRGGITGQKHAGPVSEALGGMASSYADAGRYLEAQDKRALASEREAQSVLGKLRELEMGSTGVNDDRYDRIHGQMVSLLIRLNDLFVDMNASALPVVSAIVAKADSSAAMVPSTRKGHGIVSDLGGSSKRATSAALKRFQRSDVAFERLSLRSRRDAAFHYARKQPLWAVLALLIDFGLPALAWFYVWAWTPPAPAKRKPKAGTAPASKQAPSNQVTPLRERLRLAAQGATTSGVAITGRQA